MSKKTRQRWSAEEKARIVREYLLDRSRLADIADASGASPQQIRQWSKILLESAEDIFAGGSKKIKQRCKRDLKVRERKIIQLQEVVAELSTEVLQLKKDPGAALPAAMSRPR